MKTALLILGKETNEFSKGGFNTELHKAAIETLSEKYKILTTTVEEGYDPAEEIKKFKQADVVIYQYPIYWFMMPSLLKKYIDDVYAYGEFFAFTDGAYGTGGLIKDTKVLFSTTWNAPENAFEGKDSGTFLKNLTKDDVLLPMFKTHEFCGFDVLPGFASYNVVKDPQLSNDKKNYTEHLKKILLD